MEEKIEINLIEFAEFVDRQNSGYDRSAVFYYLKDYLRSKGIDVDINQLLLNLYD